MASVDPHWSEDITVLWEDGKWRDFLPSSDLPLSEQMNAFLRFGFYFGLIASVYKQNWRWLLIMVLSFAFLTFIYYKKHTPALQGSPSGKRVVKYDEERYVIVNGKPKRFLLKSKTRGKRLPTVNNPMMNPELYRLGSGKLDKRAADPKDPRIKAAVDLAFDDGFFHDPENIYGNREGRLHFHTVPGGSIGDENGEFRYFMFGDRFKRTDKERHASFGPSMEEEIRHHTKKPALPWRPSPAM